MEITYAVAKQRLILFRSYCVLIHCLNIQNVSNHEASVIDNVTNRFQIHAMHSVPCH